jgi:hypothetical protein
MRSTLMLPKPASRAARNAAPAWRPSAAGRAAADAVVQALHPEADAAHPRAPVAGEALARHVVGIALDGHLRPRLEPEAGADPSEHRRHLGSVEQRGGAAAEEERVEGDVARPRRRARQVALAKQGGRRRSSLPGV